MVDVINLDGIRSARRPRPGDRAVSDADLIGAVEALADIYCLWSATYDKIAPEAFDIGFPKLARGFLFVKPYRFGPLHAHDLSRVPDAVVEAARRCWIPEPPPDLASVEVPYPRR